MDDWDDDAWWETLDDGLFGLFEPRVSRDAVDGSSKASTSLRDPPKAEGSVSGSRGGAHPHARATAKSHAPTLRDENIIAHRELHDGWKAFSLSKEVLISVTDVCFDKINLHGVDLGETLAKLCEKVFPDGEKVFPDGAPKIEAHDMFSIYIKARLWPKTMAKNGFKPYDAQRNRAQMWHASLDPTVSWTSEGRFMSPMTTAEQDFQADAWALCKIAAKILGKDFENEIVRHDTDAILRNRNKRRLLAAGTCYWWGLNFGADASRTDEAIFSYAGESSSLSDRFAAHGRALFGTVSSSGRQAGHERGREAMKTKVHDDNESWRDTMAAFINAGEFSLATCALLTETEYTELASIIVNFAEKRQIELTVFELARALGAARFVRECLETIFVGSLWDGTSRPHGLNSSQPGRLWDGSRLDIIHLPDDERYKRRLAGYHKSLETRLQREPALKAKLDEVKLARPELDHREALKFVARDVMNTAPVNPGDPQRYNAKGVLIKHKKDATQSDKRKNVRISNKQVQLTIRVTRTGEEYSFLGTRVTKKGKNGAEDYEQCQFEQIEEMTRIREMAKNEHDLKRFFQRHGFKSFFDEIATQGPGVRRGQWCYRENYEPKRENSSINQGLHLAEKARLIVIDLREPGD